MPIIPSSYRSSGLFRNGHASTIYSGLFRKSPSVNQEREELTLSDGDFLHLDWSYSESPAKKLVVLLHGLEGNAQRPYILGAANHFNSSGYDAVSVNFRGCSGENNRLYRSYHSGATEDLHEVLSYIEQARAYEDVYIKGFSLGGNITLKYLGEGYEPPSNVKAAVAVSVPCYLYGSMLELHKLKNWAYALRFKRHLVGRLRLKAEQFPELVSEQEIRSIKTLKDFDDVYTSRAHGFQDALEYYEKCSSLQFLPGIKIPTLLLNAANDSFLSPECFPEDIARNHNYLHLEIPKHGGHVGFISKGGVYYSESRAIDFIESV